MFPGAGANVYRNEAGEPLGWDYPSDDPPEPDDDFYPEEETGAVAGQAEDNLVYVMSCGHEHDSPFKRTEGAIVTCSQHGAVRLTEGDFLVYGDSAADQERDFAEEDYNRRFCGPCGSSPCEWDGVPDGFHTGYEVE